MQRRSVCTAVLVAAGALTLTSCNARAGSAEAAIDAASPTATAASAPGSVTPGSVTPGAATAQAVATPPASSPNAVAAPQRPVFDVVAVKRRLTALHYFGGPPTSDIGPTLRSAVMAFQKVQGIGADGSVGPQTLTALEAPKMPFLQGSSPANRVEVDLTRQVLYVVKAGAVARILPISSGNGQTYAQKAGGTARALTPVGNYRVTRRYIGAEHADLGTLYDPQYFYKGWAIHGSNSVPAGPASHGCVRVTRADATYLLGAIGIGTAVTLYGGSYTFVAGSSAAGTDAPTGDTGPAAVAPPARPTSAAPHRSSAPQPQPPSAGPRPTHHASPPSRGPSAATSPASPAATSAPAAAGSSGAARPAPSTPAR